jgi:malonate transporter
MPAVLSITSPIFLLIALGFLAARNGFFGPTEVQAIGGFVLRFAMPALIFKSLSSRPIAEIADARYLAAYAGASLVCFVLVYALFSREDGARPAMRALGGSSPNSGFVGFPTATLFVGPKAALALALCMIVENVITIPLGLALAERRAGEHTLRVSGIALRLVRNPLLIAIVAGAIASLVGLALPTPLARAVDMLAAAAPAAALLAIGGSLVGLNVGGALKDMAPVAAAKLLLHPLALGIAFHFAGNLDPDVRRAMLVMASSPVFSIYPLICRSYGEEQTGAAILLLETALAFLTMSAWALVI